MKRKALKSAIVAFAAIDIALAIFVLWNKQKRVKQQTMALQRYEEFTKSFNNFQEDFNLDNDTKQELENKTRSAEFIINNPNTSALEKFVALNNIGDYQFSLIKNWVDKELNANTFDNQKADKLKELIKGQIKRLREIDLNSQFNNIRSINLNYSFDNFKKMSNEDKKQWFNQFTSEFSSKINQQFALINNYLLQTNNSLDDNVKQLIQQYPTLALRNEVMQNVFQIENDLLNQKFRINDIAINKTHIENKLKDSSLENQEFVKKYNQVILEMNEIVNGNFENVFNNTLSLIKKDQTLSAEINNQINDLQSAISENNLARINREIFDKLIDLMVKNNLVAEKELNDHLALKSVYTYLSLSDYLENTSTLKIESSQSINDLQDALDNLKTFKNMLESKNSTNQQIIDEYINFVKAFPNISFNSQAQQLKQDPNFLNLINIKDVEKIDKQNLISVITNLRNQFNTLRNLDQKYLVAKNHFKDINFTVNSQYPSPLISKFELNEFNDAIQTLSNNKNLKLNDLVNEVNTKIDTVSTLIETRNEFRNLAKQINSTILNLNDFEKDIKDIYLNKQVKQLATDLQNRILSLNIFSTLNKNQIVENKYNIREQLRGLQKIELGFLRSKTIEQFSKLSKNNVSDFQQIKEKINTIAKVLKNDNLQTLDINYAVIENKLNDLNNRVEKEISLQFNPIISPQVLKLIQEYKFIVNVLESALKQDQATIKLYKAIEYTYNAFNKTNDPNYKPSEYEINQINALANANLSLHQEAMKMNDLLSQDDNQQNNPHLYNDDFKETISAVEKTASNAQNIVDAINEVSDVINKLDKARSEIEQDEDLKDNFQEEFAQMDQIKANIAAELAKDNVDLDKIHALNQQANDLLNSINEKRKDGFLNQKLDKIKAAIDKAYPENNLADSPGEDGLRTRLKQLYNQAAKEGLTRQEKESILANADLLSQSIKIVKNIEDKLNQYDEDATRYNSDPDRKNRVPDEILEEGKLKEDIRVLFTALGSAENIPDASKLQDASDNVDIQKAKLDLAYNKDKIETLNDRIGDKKYQIDANRPEALKSQLNNTITGIDAYSKQKLNSDSLTDTDEALNKLNNENELIDIVKKAIQEHDKIKNDPTLIDTESAIEANKLQQVISANMPNLTSPIDTLEDIQNKKDKIQKAINNAKAKHELRKVVKNDLPKILTEDEENRDLLKEVKDSIKEVEKEYQAILDANDNAFEAEDIKKKTTALLNKINQLKAKKQSLLSDYNQAKKQSDLLKTEYDKKAFHNQQAPDGDNFNNYEQARQAYLSDLDNTDKSTIASIKSHEEAIKKAYNKDVAENAIDRYNKFINKDINSVPEEDINGVKQLAEEFNNFIKATLNNHNGIETEKEALDISKQTQAMKNYNDTQKDVVDAIAKFTKLTKDNPNDNETQRGISKLKALLASTEYPTAPFNTDDIVAKNNDLIAKLTEIKEEIGRRSENKKLANELIDHAKNFSNIPGESNETRGQVNKVIEDIFKNQKQLGNLVDNDFAKITEEVLENIKDTNSKTLEKPALKNIKNKLDVINETKLYSDALGLVSGSALLLIENSNANNSNLVNSLVTNDLSPLIQDARRLYAATISSDQEKDNAQIEAIKTKYINKIKEIEAAKDRLTQANDIEQSLAQTLTLTNDVNYFEFGGISGDENLEKAQQWLKQISNSANIDSTLTSQQKTDKLNEVKSKAEAAKTFITKQKEISQQIQTWMDERSQLGNENLEITKKDEQNLIKAMWDTLPSSTQNLNANQINNNLQTLVAKFDNVKKARDERVKTANLIKSIEQSQTYTDSEQYPKLFADLKKKIKELNNENANADTVEQMKAIQAKIELLKSFLTKKLLLAQKLKEFNEYNQTVVPLNDDIDNKKQTFITEINSAEQIYNEDIPTRENIHTKEQEIDTKIKILQLHEARLRVYVKSGEVEAQINNESVINSNEKTFLNNKFKQFKNELDAIHFDNNTQSQVFTDIENKYLTGETENSIPFVFQKTKDLSIAYRDASKVNVLKQTGLSAQLDSTNVSSKFNQLNQAINEAITLNSSDQATNHQKEDKVQELKKLVNEVITAKKDSLNVVATNARTLLTQLSDGANLATDTVLNTFKDKSVDKLNSYQIAQDENPEVSIKNMNILLQDALDTFREQVQKAYQLQSTKLATEQVKLQSYKNNILLDSIWKQSTRTKFNQITSHLTEVDNFIKMHETIENNLKQYSSIDLTTSFSNAYLTKNIELIKQARSAIEQFKNSINNDFDDLFTSDTGKLVKLKAIFDKGLVTTEQKTLFSEINLNTTQNQYNVLKTQLSKFTDNNNLSSIKSNDDINKLQNDINDANQLIVSFNKLIQTFKTEAQTLLTNRQHLNEIWQYLFKADKDQFAANINTQYQSHWQTINQAISSITPKTEADFVSQGYIFDNNINGLTTYVDDTKDFIDYINNNNLNDMYKLLLHNQNPTIKSSVIYEDFNKNLLKLTQNNDSEFDITNNDSFLSMFESFADTKLDNDSKFNPIYFKVSIVKDAATNSWVTKKSSNSSNKVYKIKLKYQYTPNNLTTFNNYSGFSFEVDREITFKTKDTLALTSGTSSIFFKDNNINNLGYNSKQIIGNADELGWEDVTNRQLASEKVFSTFKKALGITDGQKLVTYHTSDKQKHFAVLNSNGSLEERNQGNDNFNIKFKFPEYYIYQQSTQIQANSELQDLNISILNNEILIDAVLPANLLVGKANYEANKNTISFAMGNDITPVANRQMPDVVLYRIRLAVDFDNATKNISLFLTHYDSYNVTKQKTFNDNSVTPTLEYSETDGSTAYVWSNTDFAKYMITHTEKWDNTTEHGNGSYSLRTIFHNNGQADNNYQGVTPNNSHIGNGVYIIKNFQTSAVYIFTNIINGDNIKQTSTINRNEEPKLSTIYNSGIVEFNFKDLKS
ncbi:hypothetical protein [Mycoplasma miroungirhinis]|uniref:Uncharacterized protein n=1 Tax=Mycoplasma miroungirhinis TaxID=754516 RepID=A0A6M4JDP3_9MOLU|nr:hypothetical protein [Mycoplasma miroungirhinis]QJR44169.1 hypothetical protein HLA92_01845 [Mycoplasma miroungirhinis]